LATGQRLAVDAEVEDAQQRYERVDRRCSLRGHVVACRQQHSQTGTRTVVLAQVALLVSPQREDRGGDASRVERV